MANKRPTPLKDETFDANEEILQQLEQMASAINETNDRLHKVESAISNSQGIPASAIDILASASQRAVRKMLEERQERLLKEHEKAKKEGKIVTPEQYAQMMTEQYNDFCIRAKAVTELYDMHIKQLPPYNKNVKILNDNIAVVNRNIQRQTELICSLYGWAHKEIKCPEMPKSHKMLPKHLLCDLPLYWRKRIWHSRHFRTFNKICFLLCIAVLAGMTVFIALDNARLSDVQEKYILLRRYNLSKKESSDFVKHLETLYSDKKTYQAEINKLWSTRLEP